jgi:uncharacterized protein with HEPN domain
VSKRYPKLVIEDMLQAIEELRIFTQGMTYDEFVVDIKTFRAVLASTLILGEAVRMLDDVTTAKAPDVPWHKLRGMRNRLIHEYFDVDSHILWQVATVEAVKLRPHLNQLLAVLSLDED